MCPRNAAQPRVKMSVKQKTFDMFGNKYRVRQFNAEFGICIVNSKEENPIDILSETEIFKNEWIKLDNRESINEHVKDSIDQLPPVTVLRLLISVVKEFNFEFLDSWKGVRIPPRFIQDGAAIDSKYSDPMIAQLVQDDVASLRELQEYYSLEDAFRMFDIKVAKAVNEAIANEVAMKGR